MVEYKLELDLKKVFRDMEEVVDRTVGKKEMWKSKIYIFVFLSLAGTSLLYILYLDWEIGLKDIIVECFVIMEILIFFATIFLDKLISNIITRRLRSSDKVKVMNIRIIFGEKEIKFYDDDFTLITSRVYGTYFENDRIIWLGDFAPLEKKSISSENLICIENIMKRKCGKVLLDKGKK